MATTGASSFGRHVAASSSRKRNVTQGVSSAPVIAFVCLPATKRSKEEGEAMKHSIGLVSVLLGLMSVPVAAIAQQVTYDFDKSTNFARLHSFTLKEGEESDNPLVDQRIEDAIVGALSARGMRKVDENADVFVVPARTTEMRKEVTAYNTGYWPYYGSGYWGYGPGYWGWGGGWGGPTTYVEERNRQYDTIVINMVDAKTGVLLWRGKGVKRVHSHWEPDTVDKKVRKTVTKILSNFPPGIDD
jgi:uncharacterized protein DUF4136